MSHAEAAIVVALGIGAVWGGLLLCYASIQLLGRFAARLTWGDGGPSVPARRPAAAPVSSAACGEEVPADILAVIATAIEVERKLYVSRPDARRPAAQS
jgi:Na+-transporting methylmalonyl-CoA/oxaloacetate decarboxylase gamma subunit